jgi:ParB/RepB/Spo0J family partition protein
MNETLREIPLEDIIYESDRPCGGMGDLDSLAASIKDIGLINPIRVNHKTGEAYTLISGRRRVEAFKKLGRDSIPAIVEYIGNEKMVHEISLAENVNRLEMHPLDEAAAFRKLLNAGEAVEELAKRYDRSISGIYQRARLTDLVDEIKEWFRAGKITLSMAAALAPLDEEQQRQFYQERKKSTSVSAYHINDFLRRIHRCKISAFFMDKKCEKCKTRTRNTDPQLFEDYRDYEDVCFDESCWKTHWEKYFRELLQAALNGYRDEHPDEPVENLILTGGYNTPDFIRELVAPDGGGSLDISGTHYGVRNRWDFSETENHKHKDALRAYCISFSYDVPVCEIGAFIAKDTDEKDEPGIPIADYLGDSPRNQAVKEILDKKYPETWDFEQDLKDRVMERYVRQAGEAGKEPPGSIIDKWFSTYHSVEAKDFKRLFLAYTGKKFTGYAKAFKEFSAPKVFFILYVSAMGRYEIPDRDEVRDENFAKKEFIKFSGMTAEEYLALYQGALDELIAEAEQ